MFYVWVWRRKRKKGGSLASCRGGGWLMGKLFFFFFSDCKSQDKEMEGFVLGLSLSLSLKKRKRKKGEVEKMTIICLYHSFENLMVKIIYFKIEWLKWY